MAASTDRTTSRFSVRAGAQRETPYEVWQGNMLIARFVREFGAHAYAAHLNKIQRRM